MAQASPGPLGTRSSTTDIDSGSLIRALTAPPGVVSRQDGPAQFEHAIQALEAELANAGAHLALDAATRRAYSETIRALSQELQAEVRAGTLSWREAAQRANALRNDAMEILRTRSTPVGRAYAERMKAVGKPLNRLVAEKTVALFGEASNFTQLSEIQQNRVYAEVVKSAGKSQQRVDILMRHASRAGRALLFVSLAISVYEVARADDKIEAVKRESAVTGAGIAGGVAGGALAGLACGPGAPVCVTVGAFVGGALAAFGVDLFW